LAIAFRQRLNRATASKIFILSQTQQKKREFKKVSKLNKFLTNIELQTKDLHRDIQILNIQFRVIAGEMQALYRNIRDLY